MDAAALVDPLSTCLDIGEDGDINPSDQDGWRDLGECIGRHENMQELGFRNVKSTCANLEALLTGMKQNRTVRELKFYDCPGEWPLGILATFFQHNQNLSMLDVVSCRGSIFGLLTAALRGCTSRSLQQITCEDSGMGDEATAQFIEALAGLPQLKKLNLRDCATHSRACGAVAALLQSPTCMLQEIHLDYSGVGDEEFEVLKPAVAVSSTLTHLHLCGMDCNPWDLVSFLDVLKSPTCMLKTLDLDDNGIVTEEIVAFADALAANHRLECLEIGEDYLISDIGFAAVTKTLCDTSSIGNTHSSNHSLRYLGLDKMPDDLQSYLRINEKEDKSLVAREKILLNFFKGDFSMEPFHENAMAPSILPHLLSWIGKMPNRESSTALFKFLQRMPPFQGNCRPAMRHSGRKRKVRG